MAVPNAMVIQMELVREPFEMFEMQLVREEPFEMFEMQFVREEPFELFELFEMFEIVE